MQASAYNRSSENRSIGARCDHQRSEQGVRGSGRGVPGGQGQAQQEGAYQGDHSAPHERPRFVAWRSIRDEGRWGFHFIPSTPIRCRWEDACSFPIYRGSAWMPTARLIHVVTASKSTQRKLTSRVVTTPNSRSVSMISRNYNLNPVIDVRRRWQGCTRFTFAEYE